jgi:plastocyanin
VLLTVKVVKLKLIGIVMDPNKIEFPNEPTVHEEPVQHPGPPDTSMLFQKDPEPVFAEPKKKFAFFAGKKKLLLLAIPLVLIMSGGLTFALFSNSAEDTKFDDSISTSSESANDQQESSNNTESTTENPAETTNSDGTAVAEPTSPTDNTTPTASSPSSTPTTGSGGGSSSGGTPATGGGTTTNTAKTYTITYSNNCYSPADLTIKFGDTIKFVNSTSNKNMWPASDDHPSHTIYPEFDPERDIAPGSSWSFMFGKTGTWDYHDHVKPSCGGTITVT